MEPGKRGDTAGADSAEGPGGVTPERAFVALRPAMFALAYRITGNRADADEIVQDAFVRLHASKARFLATVSHDRIDDEKAQDRQQ